MTYCTIYLVIQVFITSRTVVLQSISGHREPEHLQPAEEQAQLERGRRTDTVGPKGNGRDRGRKRRLSSGRDVLLPR